MRYSGIVEYAQARKMRERNTRLYRLAHWPIWIWVFFLAPGPLTFTLFAHGFGRGNLAWLAVVLAGTGAAGLSGRLPGVEPRPTFCGSMRTNRIHCIGGFAIRSRGVLC